MEAGKGYQVLERRAGYSYIGMFTKEDKIRSSGTINQELWWLNRGQLK